MDTIAYYEEEKPIPSSFIKKLAKNKIETLHITLLYDHPIDNLPDCIINIEFYTRCSIFNQPIKKYPANLKTITFGCSFNQPLDNLPTNLQELRIYGYFNQPLDHLPPNLKTLVLHSQEGYDHNLDNLPFSLQKLHITHQYNKLLDNLPPKLELLELNLRYYPREYFEIIKRLYPKLRIIGEGITW